MRIEIAEVVRPHLVRHAEHLLEPRHVLLRDAAALVVFVAVERGGEVDARAHGREERVVVAGIGGGGLARLERLDVERVERRVLRGDDLVLVAVVDEEVAEAIDVAARIQLDVDAPPAGCAVVDEQVGMPLANRVPELVEENRRLLRGSVGAYQLPERCNSRG